jgi:predicted phosphodiesterase
MLTLLHLSDLHLTTADARTQFDRDFKIREALLADLGKEGRTKFDAIVVTGDIAYHGRADEFTRARAWLEEVRKATNSSPEAIFAVPGNHDVDRDAVPKDSSLWDLHQGLRKEMPHQERLASLDKKLHDPFDFLTALAAYRTFASECGCPTTTGELAWVQVLDDGHRLEDGTKVRFHGLNSALISDGEDKKANLLLSEIQFHHFDRKPDYVNIVLCHHPHAWLLDGNEANDFFRTQAHVVLSGHDHDVRCYREGNSLRVFAGAVHPNRRDAHWEPCYHLLRLATTTTSHRELSASVETRIWRDHEKEFGPSAGARYEERIRLPDWTPPVATSSAVSPSLTAKSTLSSSAHVKVMTATSTSDAFTAARRKLIVHFFRLGTLARYKAVLDARVWEETDDALDGQARWARVFERAEKSGKLPELWDAVAAKDDTLAGQTNPFTT